MAAHPSAHTCSMPAIFMPYAHLNHLRCVVRVHPPYVAHAPADAQPLAPVALLLPAAAVRCRPAWAYCLLLLQEGTRPPDVLPNGERAAAVRKGFGPTTRRALPGVALPPRPHAALRAHTGHGLYQHKHAHVQKARSQLLPACLIATTTCDVPALASASICITRARPCYAINPPGSSCFDTALSGSDLDLLVETDLWVTKKIKSWMRKAFQVGYRMHRYRSCWCGKYTLIMLLSAAELLHGQQGSSAQHTAPVVKGVASIRSIPPPFPVRCPHCRRAASPLSSASASSTPGARP